MDYNDTLKFDKSVVDSDCIIKVIGVGGGGGNAVNHMYNEGIDHVSFALCNTDKQALAKSSIPSKLQFGSGLGAGNKPSRAEDAANESVDEIRQLLSDGTQMVFITAGMGGGTGTGAGPIVAKVAKDMGILTVGIVTIPFLFEGKPKIMQALRGVDNMAKNVDALLVINNERLRTVYSDLTFENAFKKADDTLSIAARSIVEIITIDGTINIDFADVSTTLRDGGVAIISTGFGSGDKRVQSAIEDALHSPLLNNTDIFKAKKILLFLTFSSKANFMMEEIDAIHQFMDNFNRNVDVIWGCAVDNSLEQEVKITILASGFGSEDIDVIEVERDAMRHEEEEEAEKKILDVYGDLVNNDRRLKSNKKHIHIYTIDELDDDNIISVIDSSPTYNRDNNTLKSLNHNKVDSAPANDKTENVIQF